MRRGWVCAAVWFSVRHQPGTAQARRGAQRSKFVSAKRKENATTATGLCGGGRLFAQREVRRVDELRGSPLSVGCLEELIDDNHAVVSSSVGPEYYVSILSFVDRDLLEPGCSVLLHNKVSKEAGRGERLTQKGWQSSPNEASSAKPLACVQTSSIVGILNDDVDPLVSVMKVEKAPLESYADIGGLEKQIQVGEFQGERTAAAPCVCPWEAQTCLLLLRCLSVCGALRK